MPSVLRRIGTRLGVQPGEGVVVSRLSAVFGLYVFVLLLGRTVRDSLFLSAGLSKALPVMYLGVALTVIVSAALARRLTAGKHPIAQTWRMTVVFAAVFVGIFGLLAEGLWVRPVLFGLYLWVEVVGALLMVQFWGVANDHFDPREAKRLYGLITAGQVLGNLACGAVAGMLAPVVGTPALLLIVAGALLISNGLLQRAGLRDTQTSSRGALSAPAQAQDTAATRAFIGTLIALSVLTFVTTSLVDFQFKLDASRHFSQDELTRFFGLFYGGVGACAFLIQVLVSQRLVRGIGLFGTLAIMPVGFVLLGTARGAINNFWVGATLKLDEHLLRHTINDPLSQLLVIPLPNHRKRAVQQLLGGMVKPASIGLAGLVLVLLASVVAAETLVPAVALVSALLSIMWLGAIYRARRQYVHLLAEAAQRFQQLSAPDLGYLRNARAASDLSRLLERERMPHALTVALAIAENSHMPLDSTVLRSIVGDAQIDIQTRGRALVLLDRSDGPEAQWVIKSFGGAAPEALHHVAQILQYGHGGALPDGWHTWAADPSQTWSLELLLRAVAQRGLEAHPVPPEVLSTLVDTALDWLHDAAIDAKQFFRLAQLIPPDDLAGEAESMLLRADSDSSRQAALRFCAYVWRTRLMGPRRTMPLSQREAALALASQDCHSPTVRDLSLLARLESGDGSQWERSVSSWLRVRNPGTVRSVLSQGDVLLRDMPTLEILSRPMVHMHDAPRALWPTLTMADPTVWLDAVAEWQALPVPEAPLLRRSWLYALHARMAWLIRWAAVRADSRALAQLSLPSILSRPASRPMLIEVIDNELDVVSKTRMIAVLEALDAPARSAGTLASWNQAPWTSAESMLHAAGAYLLDPSEATVETIERIVHLSTGELFRELPLQSLARIADICESRRYAAGDAVIREGTAGDSLYLVVEGDVEVQKNGTGLKTLSRGTCFGEISLLDDEPNSADIVAVTACHCLRIGRDDFEILLVDEPPFARAIMTGFAARLRGKGGRR